MSGKEIVPAPNETTAIATLRTLLTAKEMIEQIQAALPSHIKPEYMIRTVLTTLQVNEELMKCTHLSIISAVIRASQFGLMPNGVTGEAYLVPFKGQCQFIPGYRGLIKLARNSGLVSHVYSELVYLCDEFEIEYGLDRRLKHVPALDHPDYAKVTEKGIMATLRGNYAVVKYKNGDTDFIYVPRIRLEQIKNFSKSLGSSYSPWDSAIGAPEMYKKVGIRQLAKKMPLSSELQTFHEASAIADLAEIDINNLPRIDTDNEAARQITQG